MQVSIKKPPSRLCSPIGGFQPINNHDLIGKEKDSGDENIPYLVARKKKPPKMWGASKTS
jgi:hypothetical protein